MTADSVVSARVDREVTLRLEIGQCSPLATHPRYGLLACRREASELTPNERPWCGSGPEVTRVQKILEGANIKLVDVASNVLACRQRRRRQDRDRR
jgi:hypothetical protein